MQNQKNWLPGKDAIIETSRKAYNNGKVRYVSSVESSKMGVGLDGFCVCKSNLSDISITTCGLSQIRPNEDAYGRMRSDWGIELTARCRAEKLADCSDILKILTRLVQFIQTRKTLPSEYSVLSFSGAIRSPWPKSNSLAGVLIVPDRELGTIQTIHGDVRFLQIVDVTRMEFNILKKHPGMAQQLLFKMQKENPNLVFNSKRNNLYLE